VSGTRKPSSPTPPKSSSEPRSRVRRKANPIASQAKAEVQGAQSVRLKRREGTSLTRQVFLVLRDRILNGQYEPGAVLPSEDELARMYSVSRVTIRAAMAILESERLIERQHGVGTFVADHVKSSPLHAPVGDLIAHIADIARKTEVRLIELNYVKAPLFIQKIFSTSADAVFQRAVRVRSLNKRPLLYITTYLPQHIAKDFTRQELDGTSLSKLLARSGIRLHSGTQVVSAQLSDPTVATLLNVAVGAPLIQVRRQHFDETGQAVEYLELLASPSEFEVRMILDAEAVQN
jgi:GntR family transcriptional regulator